VHDAGGRLIVMPHFNSKVIETAKRFDMVCIPGSATLTEAFAAMEAGADAIKLFPAEMITPPVLRAMRVVLPASLPLFPVGGITPENMAPYREAGADGFGLGSALYAPGISAVDVAQRATAFAHAWQHYQAGGESNEKRRIDEPAETGETVNRFAKSAMVNSFAP
jgi:2-dehydro-3-deoxyphosphogalactonate aldolase